MRCRATGVWIALFLVLLSCASDVQAGQGSGEVRSVAAARLGAGERAVLDGRLDEEFWTRAVPAADFVQIDPQNGRPATERTDVRIAFSGDTFYMGVTCYDSEPEKWLG